MLMKFDAANIAEKENRVSESLLFRYFNNLPTTTKLYTVGDSTVNEPFTLVTSHRYSTGAIPTVTSEFSRLYITKYCPSSRKRYFSVGQIVSLITTLFIRQVMVGRGDDGSTPQLIATACVSLTVTLLTLSEDENPPKTGKV